MTGIYLISSPWRTITANALFLNKGTIKHAADRTVDADLTHGAVAAEPAFKVNGSRGP